MNEIAARFGLSLPRQFDWRRLALFAVLLALLFVPGTVGQASFDAFVGAYIGVAVFVYLTLLVIYGAERFFDFDLISRFAGRPKLQVVASAFLGMLPGCGGAIVVVTGYASGQLSFGAMVATLTATMGDAAFLLIAESPATAAIVLPVSVLAGIITGLITDWLMPNPERDVKKTSFAPKLVGRLRARDMVTFALFVPGIVMGIASLTQVELPRWAEFYAVGALIAMLSIWVFSPIDRLTNVKDHPLTRASEETAFIMIWVLIAFLLFDVSQAIFGYDLTTAFHGAIWLTPLMATLIGFLPGCGPQIIVTMAYLSGAIPLGALMANAISNDGDALFPALTIAPKQALWATLITAIPALIIGYGFLWISGV